MKKILGLDLGTNSIGWALVNEAENNNEKSSIIKLGVRVNPLTVDEQQNFERGKSITTNADRTLKRSTRRNLQRYKLRRENLVEILKENNFITDETILKENGNHTTFETYRLRAKAATEKISLQEFARVLLTINKKRGYKSSRKAKGTEDGALIDGMEVAKKLYNENLTPGQFCYQLLVDGKKNLPDFYRSDLQAEFEKIFDTQQTFHTSYLSSTLKEELRGKKRDAVWAICAKTFKENGFELTGIKRQGSTTEQKTENYLWRTKGLSEKLDLEQIVIVLQQINTQINSSSGYLGAISDRSKELFFNKQTVGQYQMNILDNNPNASLRNMVFYRQDYLDEFNIIWDKQAEYYKELTEKLKREIRDIVIFYQRRLKSQKGLISFCEFESRQIEVEIDGKKKIKTVGSRVIPRSSPLFQEFKIWQILNNIEITNTATGEIRPLELEEKQLLFERLSKEKELNDKNALKLLFAKDLHEASDYKINYKKIDGNRTLAELYSKLGENNILIFDSDKEPDTQELYKLWHLLYSYEGDKSNTGTEGLLKILQEKFHVTTEQAKALAGIAFQDDYGSLSAKAIRKILPYLKADNKYDIACGYAGYRHSASSLTKDELDTKAYKDKLDILPKNSLRNPVVEKILNQMVNVINTIIDTYGKPDEIRIELARELKKNAKEREELTKSIADTTKKHEGIKEKLQKEFGLTFVSRNDIVRYKLYKELEKNGYKTLYSNTYISQEKLFSGDFDIEHIIPQSRLFDDSFSNKTLELRSINLEKGNKTACDFVMEKYGETELEQYLNRLETLYKQGLISRAKYNKLKMREKDIPDGFIERDIRDTQYIAKQAKTMLGELVPYVVSTTGSITDRLREDWQLVDVMKELNWDKYNALGLTEIIEDRDGRKIRKIKDWTKRNDHRHHAMDALTVAFTKRQYIQYFNTANAHYDTTKNEYALKQLYLPEGKVLPPMPLEIFRAETKKHLENTLISIKAKNKVVTQNINTTKKAGGVNKKVQLTPRGQLHNETVYGSIKQYEVKVTRGKRSVALENKFTNRKPIDKTWKVGDIQYVVDRGIRRILQERLRVFDNDPKKAFENLDENPIWLNEKKGISIKRVTFFDVSNAVPLHSNGVSPIDFVQTSNNHHAEIYIDTAGNLKGNIVSFFDSVARVNVGAPVIDKEYKKDEGWKFLFSMKQNEYFVLPSADYNPTEVDLLNHDNYGEISRHLFRVQKMDAGHGIYFRHHLETEVTDRKELKEIAYCRKSISGLTNIVKVRINHIGQIVSTGEY